MEGSINANITTLSQFEKNSKEYGRIVINIAALQSLRHQAIQEYNANASKDYTIGQFRDAGLPYQLEDKEYPEGGY
jgi:hypothetical protein